MIGSLSLAAALAFAPAQGGGLTITNVRTTYGELGAARADARYLPGDLFFLAFDIEGLTLGPDGKVSYKMEMEVVDKAGKSIMKPMPAERDEFLPLGGSKLPGRAFAILEPNQAPGTYTCKLTVTDRATQKAQTLQKAYEVLPKNFGLVGLYTSADQKGDTPAPPVGVVGQNLHIHALLIGFGRNRMQQPESSVELRLTDDATRKETLTKPFVATVPKDLNPMEELVTVYFLVPFNREGNFTAQMKATDAVTGKTSTVSFPIRVTPAVK
jgi:hypothetical protein